MRYGAGEHAQYLLVTAGLLVVGLAVAVLKVLFVLLRPIGRLLR